MEGSRAREAEPGRSGDFELQPGAVWDGTGVTFALRSRRATAVELCLFDAEGGETARRPLSRDGDLWSARVDGVAPGQLYGYRVDGPYAPDEGHRFNPAKLLVDPWARAVSGELVWDESILGYGDGGPSAASRSDLDSARSVPKGIVVDPSFDWQDVRRPRTAWGDTVIYEAHVRGLTRLHPEVPPALRGTYLGLTHEAVVEHLVGLGVTAVELLPVQQSASERHLARIGLTNYWGYSPLAWFAPHAAYATDPRGGQVREFKTMVRELHRAGLEVILDVVYNHTVEGDESGATLSLRGLDNAAYYRSRAGEPWRTADFTGCGNTLDFSSPEVRELACESLRYWVEEMRVDGFRFDLAPVLARDPLHFRPDAAFLEHLERDPILAGVKLIAEPWDLGPGDSGNGGYALGRFPTPWAEWNDRFRDAARRFWNTRSGTYHEPEASTGAELARRLGGSFDLFPRRGACASVNYVTAHDGFTLRDLVSYERKHNAANGEANRDGSDHGLSANWGVEGPTSEPEILTTRGRLQRALLATLALARGVPMLSHGDEIGRTQHGNNNAYCQDNELTWVDWDLDGERRELLALARRAFALRRELAFTRCDAPAAAPLRLDPEGGEPAPADGEPGHSRCLGLLWGLDADPAEEGDRNGASAALLVLNGGATPCTFTLPELAGGRRWLVALDTSAAPWDGGTVDGATLRVEGRTLMCLRPEALD